MSWTLHIDDGPLPPGHLLGLDLAPGSRTLRLAPLVVGRGSAEVGQLLCYRRHYPGGRVSPAARDWLASAPATTLLTTVAAGFSATRHWTGDSVGHWTPAAWAAAEALFVALGETLALVDDPAAGA